MSTSQSHPSDMLSMSSLWMLLLLMMCLNCCCSFCLASATDELTKDFFAFAKGMQNKDKFQGDIAIDPLHSKYKMKKQLTRYWPEGVVPYQLDPVHEIHRSEIEGAMRIIEGRSCVKFVNYDPSVHKNYIQVIEGDGCWSYVGKQFYKKQELSLGKGCIIQFVILHELMHVLGFDHMHCNNDRDKYVRIRWENVQPGFEYAFDLLDLDEFDTVDFDFSSIMLYFSTAFSKDGKSVTIEPLNGKSLMPLSRLGNLSNNDIYYLNQVYNCSMEGLYLKSPLETITW